MNKNGETFQDQIDSKRRPRFSVYENFINCKKNCDGSPLYTGDHVIYERYLCKVANFVLAPSTSNPPVSEDLGLF